MSMCYIIAAFELATKLTLSSNPILDLDAVADGSIELTRYILQLACIAALLVLSTQPSSKAAPTSTRFKATFISRSEALRIWIGRSWKPHAKAWVPIRDSGGHSQPKGGCWTVSVLRTLRWQRGDLVVEPNLSRASDDAGPGSNAKLRVQIGGRELVFDLRSVRLIRLGVHHSSMQNLDRTLKLTGVPLQAPGADKEVKPSERTTDNSGSLKSLFGFAASPETRASRASAAHQRDSVHRSPSRRRSTMTNRNSQKTVALEESLLLRFVDSDSMCHALSYALRAAVSETEGLELQGGMLLPHTPRSEDSRCGRPSIRFDLGSQAPSLQRMVTGHRGLPFVRSISLRTTHR